MMYVLIIMLYIYTESALAVRLCDVHMDSLKFADHYTCRLCFVLEFI